MNRVIRYFSLLLLASFILSACGPSQASMDSTATKVAADLSSTQTAEAPTATSTHTPSPTATLTPIPTLTPTPTSTYTATPIPGPDLSSMELTLEDFPSGFEKMPDDMLKSMEANLPEGSQGFIFGESVKEQFVMGILIPIKSQAEQAVYDGILPQFVELMATSIGATTNPKEITGLDEIGDTRAGTTSTATMDSTTIRWDVVVFRRGSVLAVLLVGYPDGNKPAVPVTKITRVLDERIIHKLAEAGMSQPAVWQDDFNSKLADAWTWLNENPARWNLTEKPGFLRIYASPYSVEKENALMRSVAEGDFSIETHVHFKPDSNFQFAGLVIYQDANNRLTLGRAFCDTPNICVGNGIYFDNVQGGNLSGGNFATLVAIDDDAYLRLDRRGEFISASYSPDGSDWVEIGVHVIPVGFKVNSVGLTSSQNAKAPDQDIPADFDYFKLSEGP